MRFLVGEMLGLLAIAAAVGFVAGVVLGRVARSKPSFAPDAEVDGWEHGSAGAWHESPPPPGTEARWASDLVAVEADLDAAHHEIDRLSAERGELVGRVEESAAGMRCQWEELVGTRRRLVEVESSVVAERERVSELSAELADTVDRIRTLDQTVAAQARELDERDATLGRLRSEVFTRETELERLRSQGAAVGRQLVAFEREVPTLRQRAARADLDGSRATAHRAEVEEKRRRLADLEHQLDDVVLLRNELVFTRERESDLKTMVADSSITVQVLRSRVDELESEVGELEDELEVMRVTIDREEADDQRSLVEEGPPPAATADSPGPPPRDEPSELATSLTRIRGVGSVLEAMLMNRGVTRLEQIAALDEEGIDRLQAQLTGFPGRVRRDRWVEQARELLARDRELGGDTDGL